MPEWHLHEEGGKRTLRGEKSTPACKKQTILKRYEEQSIHV